MDAKRILTLARKAASAWVADRAPSMGAALSYYTVFSIAPLLLIVVAVAGLVFGQDAAQGAIVGQLQGLLGDKAAQAIQAALQSAARPREGVVATVLGVALLLLGATTVFAELQDDLDRVWKAPARAKPSGAWGWIRSRVLSFGMILAFGFLLLVSLAASAAIAALGDWWAPLFGGWEALAQAVNFVVSYALVTVMFAMIYRFMPHVKTPWHDVWLGAAVTAFLFTAGKQLIGMYIGKSNVASSYGAAGSLAVLLLWVYYSAQIFLLGAEFTRIHAQEHGSLEGQASEAAQAPAQVPAEAPGAVVAVQAADTPTQPARVATPALAAPARGGKVREALQRHPVPALGLAAAVGALAALAVRAKASRASPSRRSRTAPQQGNAIPPTAGQAALQAGKHIARGVAKAAAVSVMHAAAEAMGRGAKRGLASR